MDDNKRIVNQAELAQDLAQKIHYNFAKYFLVKPLDPIKVKKEFDKPVAKDKTPKADENGVEAVDYDSVETEIKEVDSDYRKGVVLKIPHEYSQYMNSDKDWKSMRIEVGDIIIYPERSAKWFDLLKDTQLVSSYDIIGTEDVVE